MKWIVLAGLIVSLLILGCTQSAGSTKNDAHPAAGTSEAQKLPLAEAQKAMIQDMKENGGDPGVAHESSAADRAFQGQSQRSGKFVALGYMTSGSASIETKDGKTFVVFSDDFSTPNGPDIVVYLTKNTGPTTREDIPQGIVLAELKSLNGKQVYEIPAGTDVANYHSVSLHCRAFNVPWSFAPLSG